MTIQTKATEQVFSLCVVLFITCLPGMGGRDGGLPRKSVRVLVGNFETGKPTWFIQSKDRIGSKTLRWNPSGN